MLIINTGVWMDPDKKENTATATREKVLLREPKKVTFSLSWSVAVFSEICQSQLGGGQYVDQ